MLPFLRQLVKEFGFTLEDDILIMDGNRFKYEGNEYCLPTEKWIQHVGSMENKSGKDTPKTIFNPMSEDIINGYPHELKTMLKLLELELTLQTDTFIRGIFKLAQQDEQINDLALQFIIAELGKKCLGQSKTLIGSKTIEHWDELTGELDGLDGMIFKLTLKDKPTKDGELYHAGIILTSPLLNKFEEENWLVKNPEKLRRTDKLLYIELIKYVKNMLLEEGSVLTTSSAPLAPGFVSLLKAYRLINSKFSFMADKMKKYDIDFNLSPTLIKDSDLDTEKYQVELRRIPQIRGGKNIMTEEYRGKTDYKSKVINNLNNTDTPPWEQPHQSHQPMPPVTSNPMHENNTVSDLEEALKRKRLEKYNGGINQPPPPPVRTIPAPIQQEPTIRIGNNIYPLYYDNAGREYVSINGVSQYVDDILGNTQQVYPQNYPTQQQYMRPQQSPGYARHPSLPGPTGQYRPQQQQQEFIDYMGRDYPITYMNGYEVIHVNGTVIYVEDIEDKQHQQIQHGRYPSASPGYRHPPPKQTLRPISRPKTNERF